MLKIEQMKKLDNACNIIMEMCEKEKLTVEETESLPSYLSNRISSMNRRARESALFTVIRDNKEETKGETT